MARRRGFFAELERQSRLAAQQRVRAEREAVRQHNAAVRRHEQAQRAAERARKAAERASEADRKRLEKEARDAHIAAMEAEVAERNAQLAETYDEIDTLLAATLEVDDYVDLETLRTPALHPPFDRTDLETPLPPPVPVPDPPEPNLELPNPPSGLSGLLGGRKKRAEAVAAAQASYEQAMARWRLECDAAAEHRAAAAERYAKAEADRLAKLEAERARYQAECDARDADTAERHRELDELIANLGYGVPDAVQEYVSIVLSHSVYPEHFPVTHTFDFDPATAELTMKVTIPGPDQVPDVKAYKYTRSADTITETKLAQREVKQRYSGAVHQVALRTLHEVFEADRRGLVKTITLEVGTHAIDPATGRQVYIPFVAVAADRETFVDFDLSAVVPTATLARLGAAVSKDPYSLVPADLSGVRRT